MTSQTIYTNNLWELTAAAQLKESASFVLPQWFAHGFTNWCHPHGRISSSKVIGPDTCKFLKSKHNMPELQYVRHYERQIYRRKGWVVHRTNATSWLEAKNMSRHKYCASYGNNGRHGDSSSYQRLHGVTLVLSEAHGNSNVGHASRDQLFVAHFLSRFYENEAVPVRRIILADPLGGLGNAFQHRLEGLRALTSGLRIDVDYRTSNASCHDVVLQKISVWSGSQQGSRFYRQRAISYCGLTEKSLSRQHILLEVHANSRYRRK